MKSKLNNNKTLYATALLALLWCSFAFPEPALTPPVFFSYAWPIGPETERDFTKLDMTTITVIDIGPDSLSYAPSIRKHYPDEFFDLWHSHGIALVWRCYDRVFG